MYFRVLLEILIHKYIMCETSHTMLESKIKNFYMGKRYLQVNSGGYSYKSNTSQPAVGSILFYK